MAGPRIPWEDIRDRLSRVEVSEFELSAPVLGVKLRLKDNEERRIAEQAITFIEDCGIFYAPYEWEHPKETYDAASEARAYLNDLLQKLERASDAHAHLSGIRTAVRDFQRAMRGKGLSEIISKSEMSNEDVQAYDGDLIRLRRVSGREIASLAVRHHLSVSKDLEVWLPS